VKGDLVYLLSEGNILILDTANPVDIRMVARIESSADMIEADVEGDYLFAFDNRVGLRVFDVSSPEEPRHINLFAFESRVSDFCYANQRMFLGVENTGVLVLDVDDVMNITDLEFVQTRLRSPEYICVNDPYLFIGINGGFSFARYDLTDIDNPVYLPHWTYLLPMALSDSFLFVRKTGNDPLIIFNYRDPDELIPVGGMSNGKKVEKVKLAGERLYLADTIMDISDPLNPVKLGDIPVQNAGAVQVVKDFQVQDNLFYASDDDFLKIFDVTNPEEPLLLSVLNSPHGDRTFGDVVVNGDYSYLITRFGLKVLDVSDPRSVREIYVLSADELGEYGSRLLMRDNYLFYLSLFKFGIIDITNPAEPRLISNISSIPWGFSFAIYRDYAYITTEKGLNIIDFSDIENPLLVSDSLWWVGMEMTVSGNHLFLSEPYWNGHNWIYDGLKILSLEDPTHPCLAGYYDSPGNAGMIAIRDNLAYVADGSSLVILDISEALTKPDETGHATTPSDFSLSTPFPNPFNSTTTIGYSLHATGNVSLMVFDLSGREVARLADGVKAAGMHEAVWVADGMSAGIYFVRLQTKNSQFTKKILLVK